MLDIVICAAVLLPLIMHHWFLLRSYHDKQSVMQQYCGVKLVCDDKRLLIHADIDKARLRRDAALEAYRREVEAHKKTKVTKAA
jgi:hypothetical protein